MMQNLFKVLKCLFRTLYLMFPPLIFVENASRDEINESVVEVFYKSNNDSSPPVHVYITEYKLQNLSVDQLKDMVRKS